MGLCYSINRQYHRLRAHTADVPIRTFRAQTRLVRLHQIIDGDTFRVITKLNDGEPYQQYSLRLSGMDTPEMRPLLSDPLRDKKKAAAIYVRDQLQTLYPTGTIFIVEFNNEDKYGRLLGRIWTTKRSYRGWGKVCKDQDVCKLILDRGWALPYTGGKKTEFTQPQLLKILGLGLKI